MPEIRHYTFRVPIDEEKRDVLAPLNLDETQIKNLLEALSIKCADEQQKKERELKAELEAARGENAALRATLGMKNKLAEEQKDKLTRLEERINRLKERNRILSEKANEQS